jgi:hypothetical protein
MEALYRLRAASTFDRSGDISQVEVRPMHLPRSDFFRAGFALVVSALTARLSAGQDRRPNSIHPPEPSGHELDVPLARDRHPSNPSARDTRQRDMDFRNGLDQLLASVTKLRDQLNAAPLSEILSVQIYRETQLMERIVKNLKSLAKS